MTVYNIGGAIGCLQLATDIREQMIEHDGRKYRIRKDSYWKWYNNNFDRATEPAHLFCGGAPASFSIKELKGAAGKILDKLEDMLPFFNEVTYFSLDLNDATRNYGFGKEGVERILYRSIHPKSCPYYFDKNLALKLADGIWEMIQTERNEVYEEVQNVEEARKL